MDFTEIIAEVKSVITNFGRSVVLKNPTTPTDSTKPWRNAASFTTVATLDAVFIPVAGTKFGLEFIPKDLLTRVKEVCLIAPNSVDISDVKIITDAVNYRVDWCYKLQPGNDVLLYAFGVSR